jgi:mono/diheme cytochrome c family protein
MLGMREKPRRVAASRVAFLGFGIVAAICIDAGCKRSRAAPDWDHVAFALELVRDEYGEQIEGGDFSSIPALTAVLDGGRAALVPLSDETRPIDAELAKLRARLLAHEAPRVISKETTSLLATLAKGGPLGHGPPSLPDLRRGSAVFAIACVPCHGALNGPLPPAAANMVPRPTTPNRTALTPYELFNRITYGGAGTAMPAFAESLPEIDRWDIAFYLFAERWPPCVAATAPPAPSLAATELAHLSDFDLWKKYGWGSSPCLRRNFH